MARSHCNAESFNKFPKLGNSFNNCTFAAESLHALMQVLGDAITLTLTNFCSLNSLSTKHENCFTTVLVTFLSNVLKSHFWWVAKEQQLWGVKSTDCFWFNQPTFQFDPLLLHFFLMNEEQSWFPRDCQKIDNSDWTTGSPRDCQISWSWRQNIADSDQNTCCCEKLRHHQGFYIRDDCALENQMNFQNTIIPKGWNSFVDISDISADHKLHLLSRSNISDPLGRPTSWLLWYLSQCWSTSHFVLYRIAM